MTEKEAFRQHFGGYRTDLILFHRLNKNMTNIYNAKIYNIISQYTTPLNAKYQIQDVDTHIIRHKQLKQIVFFIKKSLSLQAE